MGVEERELSMMLIMLLRYCELYVVAAAQHIIMREQQQYLSGDVVS